MIGQDDISRIQNALGKLAIKSVAIDLDGFIEAADFMASPRALTAGIDPGAVSSAGAWADLALLLKPFRDAVVQRIAAIREEMLDQDEDIVSREVACPSCGERDADRLAINEDDSVVCATCGRRYQLPGGEEATG